MSSTTSRFVLVASVLFGFVFTAQAVTLPTIGLQAHFKGDAGVSTGGGGITQWLDQASLNGLNNGTSTSGTEPQISSAAIGYHASFPTVSFTGGDRLAFSLPNANTFTGLTVIAVGNTGATKDQYEIILSTGGTGASSGVRWGFGMGGDVTYGLGWGGPTSGVGLGNGSAISTNTWHVMSWAMSDTGNSWGVRRELPTAALVHTVADTSFFTGNWNGYLGVESPGAYAFSGELAELLIYDRQLSAGEYQNVLEYLDGRFFTAPPLPAPEPGTGILLVPAVIMFLRRQTRLRAE